MEKKRRALSLQEAAPFAYFLPALIEFSALSLNEHLSALAARAVVGRADVSLPGFSGAVWSLIF